MKKIVVTAILFTICWPSFGQTVSSVSGSVSHGQSVTVSGSAFGSKTVAGPVVFDNIETGSFSGGWSNTESLDVVSESRHGNSTHSGHLDFQGSVGTNLGYFTGGSNSPSWFVQYWFKLDANFDWGTGGYGSGDDNLANVKLFRMWSTGGTNENFVLATMGYAGGSLQYTAENVSDPRGQAYFGDVDNWSKDTWHLFQFEYKDSGQGSNDGVFRWWVDGTLFVEDTDLMTRESSSDYKRPLIVGFYDSWNDSNTDEDDWYIDDAYIDNTWSRVELGNSSVYGSCTHREIQIPTAWATNEITVTVNQGSFAADDAAYLFVVDADGNVSDGYAVTIGASESASITAPTSLTANKVE